MDIDARLARLSKSFLLAILVRKYYLALHATLYEIVTCSKMQKNTKKGAKIKNFPPYDCSSTHLIISVVPYIIFNQYRH